MAVPSVFKYFAGSSRKHICCVYSSAHICWPLHFSCGATASIAQRVEVSRLREQWEQGRRRSHAFISVVTRKRGVGALGVTSSGTTAPDSDIHFPFVFRCDALKYLARIPDLARRHTTDLCISAHFMITELLPTSTRTSRSINQTLCAQHRDVDTCSPWTGCFRSLNLASSGNPGGTFRLWLCAGHAFYFNSGAKCNQELL